MVQNMSAPMGTGWRTSPENTAVTAMPVATLGDPSWHARPAPTPAVLNPPQSTGAPGWRPSRAD